MPYLDMLDLPKATEFFQFYPPRPVTFRVRRRGTDKDEELVCSLQEPLRLYRGDSMYFDAPLDPVFRELLKATSAHPQYATIRVNPEPQVVQYVKGT